MLVYRDAELGRQYWTGTEWTYAMGLAHVYDKEAEARTEALRVRGDVS